MPELTTYLKKLKFDPRLNDSLFAKYIRNTRLILLFVLLIVLIGTTSFLSLPRVLNPQINIPIVNVVTTLPGASPDDIESLVTIPIEDGLENLKDIKTITSTSQDSVSIVWLEFESGINPDKAKSDVQSAVDSITDLPEDAKSPTVQKFDFENEPVWTFSLSSKTDSLSLKRFAKILRDKIEDLPSVDRVQTTGIDDEEIQVLINPEKLAQYGLNPILVSQTITNTTGSFPAGSVTTGTSSFVLSLDPTVTKIEDLRNIKITANNTTVLLSDIATIQRRSKPDTAVSYIANKNQTPIETIRFDIFKASSANITDAVSDTKEVADKQIGLYDNKFTLSSVLNSGTEVDEQYYDLIRDLLITVSLVFLTLFLFLGIRQAFVASFAIPLSFLITFIVMGATGVSLSFIAFFSLLLSLGLLVDDTIVVISAITAYYRSGKFTPLEAGLLVWRDFRTAILTTTLTTVWAFVPLLLSTGIIGEFIRAIPIVVSTTLLGSLTVALFVTLPFIIILLNANFPYRVTVLLRLLGVLFIFVLFLNIVPQGPLFLPAVALFMLNVFVYFQVRYILYARARARLNEATPQKEAQVANYLDRGVINFQHIEQKYRTLIDKILSNKVNLRSTIVAVILFSLFSYMLLPLGFVKNEFFPKNDQEFLYLSLEMPPGTNLKTTEKEMLMILDQTRRKSEVTFATGTVRLGIDPGRGFASAGDNVALVTLILPPREERDTSSIDFAESLRDSYSSYQKGKVSVVEVSDGPPAGSDLQIKLSGEDLATLDMYANQIQTYMEKQSGVTNVSKSIVTGTSKIVFVPDYQKMLDAKVTQDQLGLFLRTYGNGFTLKENAKLENGTDEAQNIVLRTATLPQSAQNVTTVSLPTPTGPVPLVSLGKFELRPNPSLITREDGKRTLSVSASVRKGVVVSDANAGLEKYADSLNLDDGYAWSTGGVNEENNNSVRSILLAMVLSFLLIIITMVLQFSSFRKAFIVMLVIPLSISGVFIVFSLTQTPLSFPALIGVLALFGIVVKNSILIVDKINQNLKHHMPYKQAIVDGAESRLEPITLTTFATIAGLIPITLSDPLWRGLGGAIISGLFFSGTMMLFFIPAVYYLMFRNSEGKVSEKAKKVL